NKGSKPRFSVLVERYLFSIFSLSIPLDINSNKMSFIEELALLDCFLRAEMPISSFFMFIGISKVNVDLVFKAIFLLFYFVKINNKLLKTIF
ncbi:MAG: hypothetical protein SFU27_12415, partial [Thermonemataceae bacterium]|nr:hypothetical protein [Thermonemataceae bacterium]